MNSPPHPIVPLAIILLLTFSPALAFASDMCDLAHVYLIPAFAVVLLLAALGYVARDRWNFIGVLGLSWVLAAIVIGVDLYTALASHGPFKLAHPSFLPAAAIKLVLLLAIEALYRRFGKR